MTEYIEREALIDEIEGTTWYHISCQKILVEGAACEADALYKATDIYNVIKSAPTADVVEVVRCKDCRCFVPIILNGKVQERGYCTLGCDWVNRKETDFCNYGERKEVATNG